MNTALYKRNVKTKLSKTPFPKTQFSTGKVRPTQPGATNPNAGVDTYPDNVITTPYVPVPPIRVDILLPIDWGTEPAPPTPTLPTPMPPPVIVTPTPPVVLPPPPVVITPPPICLPPPPICLPPERCPPRPPRCDWFPTPRGGSYSCSVVTAAETKWYLGLTGMVLPGQGFAVETVEKDSPAEAAGLAPGMVITSVNGVQIVDVATLGSAIEASVDGLLELEVMITAGTDVVPATVQMTRIVVSSF